MRFVIAKKEHPCKGLPCKNKITTIKEGKICVQVGRKFYHKPCYDKLSLVLPEKFPEPKLTDTVKKKKIVDWYVKEELKQKS